MAYSSFEGVSSDHRVVTPKISLGLRRNKIKTVKTTRYDWSSLTNRNISYKYTVSNEFDTFQEISETHNPNGEYEKFVTGHMEATAEWIPPKPRAKHSVPWETLVVRKKRNNAKRISLFYKRNPN